MIITTSWDDGHFYDLRIAELLDKYQLQGTFYVPIRNDENFVMNSTSIIEIGKRYEIGGHTVNHKYLNNLGDEEAEFEISTCKVVLENLLGKEIFAFCFPGGKFSKRDIILLKKSGFLFGRTTSLFQTSLNNNSLMNTTLQCFNHDTFTLNKHCVKRAYFYKLIEFRFFLAYNKNFRKLSSDIISNIQKKEDFFHIWGHSWEINQYNLWYELEETFKMLSDIPNVTFVNNTTCWKLLTSNSNNQNYNTSSFDDKQL